MDVLAVVRYVDLIYVLQITIFIAHEKTEYTAGAKASPFILLLFLLIRFILRLCCDKMKPKMLSHIASLKCVNFKFKQIDIVNTNVTQIKSATAVCSIVRQHEQSLAVDRNVVNARGDKEALMYTRIQRVALI